MNDRFKFRFWNNLSKRYENTYDLKSCEVLDYVIPEQCTGLKDKNGKLIYENDVLEVSVFDKNNYGSKKKTRWSVEYKIFNNNIGFMVYGINRRWHALMTSNMLYNAEAVVIGNIHENADLLENEE